MHKRKTCLSICFNYESFYKNNIEIAYLKQSRLKKYCRFWDFALLDLSIEKIIRNSMSQLTQSKSMMQ